ncbi:MAG: hypothetical protein JHC93_02590 [Parachlamydiales bacterium]|nr:hypothetical protein [Parachlamydiales bacterium]
MLKFFKKWMGNPFDRLLKKSKDAGQFRFLIVWNRGLGDIALGLYALVHRIRTFIPEAEITFITRKELHDGFKLLPNVKCVVVPSWKRKEPLSLSEVCPKLGISISHYDQVFENVNATQWLSWQIGHLVPKLEWKKEYNQLCERFNIPEKSIGLHVNSETGHFYGYNKDWPYKNWQELINLLDQTDTSIVLFGLNSDVPLQGKNVIDCRGKTTLLEMLSIIVNRLDTLVAPDSGVLSLAYYLDTPCAIHLISLWADPKQGVLKQNVESPNTQLIHTALIGENQDTQAILVRDVLSAIQRKEKIKTLCA